MRSFLETILTESDKCGDMKKQKKEHLRGSKLWKLLLRGSELWEGKYMWEAHAR